VLDLVIRGGHIITAEGEFDADLGVVGERIAALAAPGTLSEARRTIDAAGLLLLPGLVDPHVHMGHRIFLEGAWVPAADDFATGSATAAAGGTTTVIDFAIQRDLGPVETVAARRGEADGRVVLDYALHPALTRATPENLAAIPALLEAGCPSLKLYMIYRKQGRMADDAVLFNALAVTRGRGLVGVHAENSAIAEYNTELAIQEGRTTPIDFARSKPNYVEAEAINRALFLAEETGGTLYIFHLSARESLTLVAMARARGVKVIAETCAHYLTLSDEVYEREDGHRFICSPPLRSRADVEALWEGVDSGLLSVVSSDHCGFDSAAKDRGRADFTKVPNGLPSVGARLPLIYTHGVLAGRITLPRMVDLLSTAPAKIFGLYPQKGALLPGSDADLVLVDPGARRTVSASSWDSPVDWTPFQGMELGGWPVATIARGVVRAEEGRCRRDGEASGRFLPRSLGGVVRAPGPQARHTAGGGERGLGAVRAKKEESS
jgi:dihydropyrimidinase